MSRVQRFWREQVGQNPYVKLYSRHDLEGYLRSIPEDTKPLWHNLFFHAALDQKKQSIRESRLASKAKRKLSAGVRRGAIKIWQDEQPGNLEDLRSDVTAVWKPFFHLTEGMTIRPKKARMLKIMQIKRFRPLKKSPIFILRTGRRFWLARKKEARKGKYGEHIELVALLLMKTRVDQKIRWEAKFNEISDRLNGQLGTALETVMRRNKL